MKAVIHYPYFLPWLGYFSKLPFSDKFIILDNINFTKGFYLDRTKYIDINGEVKWLSMPIGQNFKIKLNQIEIINKDFLSIFIKTIESCYAKADFYKPEWKFIKNILISSISTNHLLVDININLIKGILNYLELKSPEIILASNFEETNDRTDRIISLCKHTNCKTIIIGGGSSIKEHDWNKVQSKGISVLIQDYFRMHPSYKQIRRQKLTCEKGVTIIDAILNIGKEKTKELITDLKYSPVPLKQ